MTTGYVAVGQLLTIFTLKFAAVMLMKVIHAVNFKMCLVVVTYLTKDIPIYVVVEH